MNLTFMHLVCFTLGFIAGVVPGIVSQYFYTRHFKSLGEVLPEEDQWSEVAETKEELEDVIERERDEERNLGFFGR